VQVKQAWLLALAHYQAGRLEEAGAACMGVLQEVPDHAEALHLLGVLAYLRGDASGAREFAARAHERAPDQPEFLNTLGLAHQACGEPAQAERCLRAALSTCPDYAAAHGNLGIALRSQGMPQEAEAEFREALRLDPGFAEAHNNLGNLLLEFGHADEAEQSLRRAIELRPGYAEAHANLGIVLRAFGRLPEAEASARRAIELNPQDAGAHNVLGVALFGLGRTREAEQCYRAALARDPSLAVAQGNLVYLMNCLSGRSLEEIYAEHREFARRFCPAPDAAPHGNVPDPARRLRIGYVSGDFRHHSVAYFIEAVLASHDRRAVEVYCYYNLAHADAATARLRGLADHWRDVHALDDEALARQVREDCIDILVDLSGYTANNRLPAFGRRPAPVQATWLGYLNTTGLDAIDYRLTDAQASPPGPLDRVHSERLLRLPDSQWCYLPPTDAPDVAPAPSQSARHVTFASFSIPAKLDDAVLRLWGRLLDRVPDARLLVVTNGLGTVPDAFVESLVRCGMPRERLDVEGSMPFVRYLAAHARADIVLDTFPFTGGTTTCHALWMGVPVVTLAGETATSRGGASALNAVGLGELVATTEDAYLEIAAALARDRVRLTALRSGMRERMRASPLTDAPRFTRHLEAAYRQMWREWCVARGSSPSLAQRIRRWLQ